MKRIAIIGKARSGKTTVLELMKKMYEREGMKVAHYDVSHALYPITETLFPGSVYGENKDRSKLQLVGQTIRQYDPDFWINTMHNSILEDRTISDYVDVLIITGVRQPNEYKYLKENNFRIIKVDSSRTHREQRAIKNGDVDYKQTFDHETEKYIDKFVPDFEIENDGSKRSLEYKIRMLL